MPLHSLSGCGVWSDLLMQSNVTVRPPTSVPSYVNDTPYDASAAPWSARAADITRTVATLQAQHAFDLQRDRADRERAWRLVQAEAQYATQTPRKPLAVPEFISSNPADLLRHRAQVAAWNYLPVGGRESLFPFSPIARKPPVGSGKTPFSAPSKLSHRDRLILDSFDFSYKPAPPLIAQIGQPEIPMHQQGAWPPSSHNLSSNERTSGNTSTSSSAFRTATSSTSHEFTSGSSDPLSSLAQLTEGISQRGSTTGTSSSERDGSRMFRVENRDQWEKNARSDRRRSSHQPSIQAPPITTLPDREAQLVLSPFGAAGKGSLQRDQPLVNQFSTPGANPSFGSPLTHRSDMSTLLGLTPAANHTHVGPTFGLSDTDRTLASPLTPLQPHSSKLRGLSPSRTQQATEAAATRGPTAAASRCAAPSGSSSSALHSSTDIGNTSSSDRDVSSMYSNSGFLSMTHLDG